MEFNEGEESSGDKWCLFGVERPQCIASQMQFTLMDSYFILAYFDYHRYFLVRSVFDN